MTILEALKLNLLAVFCVFAGVAGVCGQTDSPRRTTAITYPLDEPVIVQFRGTTRFPRMKGEARIKRTSRNGSEIELSVSKMPRPFELGAGYATYVLWAISPDGQADNLGEIKRRGFFEFDSKISVTTKLQTFALIITAEPHFLVRRPSQEIMLENLSPYATSGKTIATTPAIQYFGNSSDYFRDTRTPEIAEVDYSKTPSAILQAKQAVALARYAGADRDAVDELREAETLLKNAEDSWKAGRDEDLVDISARKSIGASVKAEEAANVRKNAREKRNEKIRSDAEARQAEDRFTDAQSQIESLRSDLAAETRSRELAERDVQNYTTQMRELRDENGRLREELGKIRLEAENAKTKLDTFESERQVADAQNARKARLDALQTNRAALIQSLKKIGTVASTDRGIAVTVPENLWAAVREPGFALSADAKLADLGEILTANPDYRVLIESHTDSRGVADELTSLTEQRARAIADRLTGLGVPAVRIEAKGFGGSVPVAANTTTAGRARNRRVQITLIPAVEQ
ncbi:MAG: OmpA family protein [Pyrinomonadaceae bacterium]